jgi:ribosomal subunit interface protein
MQMTFRYTHIDHSPALEEHATAKLASVAHLIPAYEKDGEARAEVEFERTTEHHKSGDVFHVKVRLHLPVTTIEADAVGDDIYGAVDRVRDTLHGNVQRFKEQDVARRHAEE